MVKYSSSVLEALGELGLDTHRLAQVQSFITALGSENAELLSEGQIRTEAIAGVDVNKDLIEGALIVDAIMCELLSSAANRSSASLNGVPLSRFTDRVKALIPNGAAANGRPASTQLQDALSRTQDSEVKKLLSFMDGSGSVALQRGEIVLEADYVAFCQTEKRLQLLNGALKVSNAIRALCHVEAQLAGGDVLGAVRQKLAELVGAQASC